MPIEDDEAPASEESEPLKDKTDEEEDEAVIEDVSDDESKSEEKEKKTKTVLKEEWMHLNSLPPVWTR